MTTQSEREAIAASARKWRCFGQTVEGDLESEELAAMRITAIGLDGKPATGPWAREYERNARMILEILEGRR